jgi:hypothetical protein
LAGLRHKIAKNDITGPLFVENFLQWEALAMFCLELAPMFWFACLVAEEIAQSFKWRWISAEHAEDIQE